MSTWRAVKHKKTSEKTLKVGEIVNEKEKIIYQSREATFLNDCITC